MSLRSSRQWHLKRRSGVPSNLDMSVGLKGVDEGWGGRTGLCLHRKDRMIGSLLCYLAAMNLEGIKVNEHSNELSGMVIGEVVVIDRCFGTDQKEEF